MNAISSDDFLTWAASVGIGFHPGCPDARSLVLLPPHDFRRFWEWPLDPTTWPLFIESILDGLDPWSHGFLWPHGGRWPAAADSASAPDHVQTVILKGAGIPDGWPGAVRFDHDERAGVLAVLFINLVTGWCSSDDVYFIPEHGRQIVQTDHHAVIHVKCLEEARILQFVEHMENAKYPLPTELPDETFIWPDWMKRPTEE